MTASEQPTAPLHCDFSSQALTGSASGWQPRDPLLCPAHRIVRAWWPGAGAGFLGPFGADDPDFLTSTVEDDSVSSSMTDYADSSETLRVRAVTKAASDLSVSLEINDFVDHGPGAPKPARVALNPSTGANCISVGI
jgi:hypothetical protein